MSIRGRRRGSVATWSAVLLLLATLAPASAAEPQDRFTASPLTADERITGNKAASSSLAETDPALLARNDATPVNVMIKFDYDASAAYGGQVRGLEATSPLVTGDPLTGKSAAERKYGAYVAGREAKVVKDLQKAIPTAKIGQKFRTVYGGVAAVIPARSVEAALKVDGVVAVQYDRLNQPLTDSSPDFINATDVYDDLGTTAEAGEGVIFANLDTGIWPEHESFADNGVAPAPPGPARVCNYGDNPLTPANDPFVCNRKLIGGQPFLATYLSNPARAAAEPFHTARDSNGHGTHTASTSAGNIVEDVEILGSEIASSIHGIAPGAYVMGYKVCGIQGCFSSDSAAAVQRAILDGVDVINFSISGGTNPFTDPVELAFLDAYAAGVFVSASAGNEGPGASTANHLSPWTMTVAASTQTREFFTTLSLTAGNGDTFTMDGASITPGVTTATPVVLSSAAPYSRPLCDAPAAAGTFTGKIVACQRGVVARVDKGFNVLQGGAVGMILYNPALADIETDTHWLPTVHLADGTSFVAFMNGHTGVTGSFPAGTARDGQGDVMAAFSSRGPAGLFIKPDVTAPGVQILAGDTPFGESITEGPPGEFFQAIAGTSMSSPHVAGAAVLLRKVHPNWTPGQVKSALMTTAIQDVVKEDLTTPADPFDFGSGRIDVGAANAIPLTFDETAANFFALGDDPVQAVHLNIPSVNAPIMPGRIVTNRKVTNASNQRQRYTISSEAPDDSTITVTPRRLNLRPGDSATLTIVIESDAPLGEQQFGSIHLDRSGSRDLHLPVAFIHTQGAVSLAQDCTAATLKVGFSTQCDVEATNLSFNEQEVDFDSFTNNRLDITAASGAIVLDRHHVRKANVRLAGAKLGVPSFAPGASPGGFLPLAGFGIAPNAIGDEDILNYSVPNFVYNGVTYDTLGVDSNGYVIAGGGTSEDNECCNLPTGPDPARPNNFVAPFWTDLDGTGEDGIYAGVLTDGVNSWLVIEYQVNVFGTTSNRHFQIWIGVDGVQDISMVYDPVALPADPNGQDFLVGVENGNGEGEVVSGVLPTTDQVVTSTDPTPGDTVSYSFTVKGRRTGAGVVTTEMDATDIPGTTIVRTQIQVVPR